MSSSLSYSRRFIILKKEYATVKKGNIKGHCKLERRGPKVFLTVNVENGDIETIYNVALLSNDKHAPIINLGKLFTDNMGKGKEEYTLTERELGGRELKVNGILVMTDKDILLGGYIDKEDGSIERYINSLILEAETEETEETPAYEETHTEEAYVEEVRPVESVISEEEYIPVEEVSSGEEIPFTEEVYPIEEDHYVEEMANPEEYMPMDTIPTEEVGPIEPTQDPSPYLTETMVNDFDDDYMEPDYRTLDYIKKLNQKNQTINYVLSILRFFPYAEPFKYNLKGYNWWLVDLDSENEYKAFLPYFAHVVGGNNKEYYDSSITTCTQLMNKYQHYLFGLYNEGEEVKYFLYGIPGTFTLDEHPYRGQNGFNTWYEGQNVPGYWIIYIDPMTGKAVDLPNPMIPIT